MILDGLSHVFSLFMPLKIRFLPTKKEV